MCNSHMYGDWIPVFSVYTNPFHSCVCFITYNKALYLSSTEVFIISQSNNTKSQQLVMVYLLYHANNSLNQWRPDQPQRKEGQKERKKEKVKKKKEKREGSGNIKAWVTLRFKNKNKNKTQLEHVYVYCSGEEWITFLTEWSYALTLTLTSSTGTNWLFLSSFHGVKNQALSQPPDRVAMNFAHSHTLFKGL